MAKYFPKYLFFSLLAVFCSIFLQGQDKKKLYLGYTIEHGDTVYMEKIKPIYVFNRPASWQNSREWRRYYRTVYNFAKTYPYALKACEIMKDADSTIANSNFTRREKEKYIKAYEKRLFKEFEKPLRKLSINQGKMLLKLIDREAGMSSYQAIRNYKGGATAGFWQGVAKLFGSDLKKKYDKEGEDRMLEDLVQMYHEGSFWYLYYSMFRE